MFYVNTKPSETRTQMGTLLMLSLMMSGQAYRTLVEPRGHDLLRINGGDLDPIPLCVGIFWKKHLGRVKSSVYRYLFLFHSSDLWLQSKLQWQLTVDILLFEGSFYGAVKAIHIQRNCTSNSNVCIIVGQGIHSTNLSRAGWWQRVAVPFKSKDHKGKIIRIPLSSDLLSSDVWQAKSVSHIVPLWWVCQDAVSL